MQLLTIVVLLTTTFVSAVDFENCRILDLTHTLAKGVPHWGSRDFELEILVRGRFSKEVPLYVEANIITVPEHFGTHVDSPAHFYPRPLKRIDEMPLRDFIGPAVVFDISEMAKENSSYGLNVTDIEQWEEKHGRIPVGSIALVYTGWEFKWTNTEEYLGAGENDTLLDFRHPGVTYEAAEFLAAKRKIKGLGIDTISFDIGGNPQFPAHLSILGRNIMGYENLNNLHKMPPKGATVALMPMKIEDGSGGPIRAFAVGWDGPNDPCYKG